MENKLGNLLNMLIQRGWKPFGEWCHRSPYKRVGIHKNYNKERIYVLFYSNNHSHWKVLRQVVSKESWLWQFVCENGMVKMEEWFYWQNIFPLDSIEYDYTDYQYWILESSLKDENELEDFLLKSIELFGNSERLD